MARSKTTKLSSVETEAIAAFFKAMHKQSEYPASQEDLPNWFKEFYLPPIIELCPTTEDDESKMKIQYVKLLDQFGRLCYVKIKMKDRFDQGRMEVDNIVINDLRNSRSFIIDGDKLSQGELEVIQLSHFAA